MCTKENFEKINLHSHGREKKIKFTDPGKSRTNTTIGGNELVKKLEEDSEKKVSRYERK